MTNSYFSFAYGIFGTYFQKRRLKYQPLRQNLLRSRMNIGYDMYLSGAVLTAILCTIVMFICFNLILSIAGIPEIPGSRLHIPAWTVDYIAYKAVAFHIIGSVILGGGCFAVVYRSVVVYPAIIAADRKRKIDQMLPYAINYMSAMSGAGILPVNLFRSLASNNIYGEVSVEASYLVRDLEMLGNNLVSAMKNLAATTPSTIMQEFLQGAITVVTSGGELEPYFKIKMEQYIIENRQRQKEFLETLGLLGETYVTAFVAGPLFLIIVISIMSIMGGADMLFLYALVYAIVPVGSIMFIILISTITPEE